MADEEENRERDFTDQPGLPPQGSSRTAVVVVLIVVALLVGAFALGFLFSRPGEGVLIIPGGAQTSQ
jgi:hypothetical protein